MIQSHFIRVLTTEMRLNNFLYTCF